MGEELDEENSTLFAKESYYYKPDLAGRVPVPKTDTIHLVMINYNEEEESSTWVRYGGALQNAVLSLASLAATLSIAYLC